MRKTNFFHKYLNNISYSINKLLENNLNKLSSKNLTNLARSNKTILTFVALLLLFITYLSIPSFFKHANVLSTSSDRNKFTDFDLPMACEANNAHLIDKLLSPSIVIVLLKGFIFLNTLTEFFILKN